MATNVLLIVLLTLGAPAVDCLGAICSMSLDSHGSPTLATTAVPMTQTHTTMAAMEHHASHAMDCCCDMDDMGDMVQTQAPSATCGHCVDVPPARDKSKDEATFTLPATSQIFLPMFVGLLHWADQDIRPTLDINSSSQAISAGVPPSLHGQCVLLTV